MYCWLRNNGGQRVLRPAIGQWSMIVVARLLEQDRGRRCLLDDDFAGLKEDFQWNFTVVMPLNVFGAKFLEC